MGGPAQVRGQSRPRLFMAAHTSVLCMLMVRSAVSLFPDIVGADPEGRGAARTEGQDGGATPRAL